MPGRRRKNFKTFRDVAKDGASHFEVGHRSQKDPMLADSEASQHVLVPKTPQEKHLEEQQKYGIYYDDDYDYLQHLRDVSEIHDSEMKQIPSFMMKEEEGDEGDDDTVSMSGSTMSESRLQLPSSVLGSTVERGVGLLNMAAPTPGPKIDWDPDVVAALDDDFDFEDPDNVLEDDFMLQANADGDLTPTEEEEEEEGGLASDFRKLRFSGHFNQGTEDEDEYSDVASDKVDVDDDDEGWTDDDSRDMDDGMTTLSKYSSVVLPGNENLRLLDAQTAALIEREYTEDKIGALDCEELDGRVSFSSDLFQQAIDEMMSIKKKTTMKDIVDSKERVRPVVPESWQYIEEKDYSVEEDIDYSQDPICTAKKPEFDAQSILSTYSRTKNLPTPLVIPEEWNSTKKKRTVSEATSSALSDTSLPGLTLKELEQQTRTEKLADAPSTYRPKGETPEEKKERKNAIKAHRKERRAEKKLNRLAFRSELKRQNQVIEHGAAQKRTVTFHS